MGHAVNGTPKSFALCTLQTFQISDPVTNRKWWDDLHYPYLYPQFYQLFISPATMNVFSGANALLDFHDPSKHLPLPVS